VLALRRLSRTIRERSCAGRGNRLLYYRRTTLKSAGMFLMRRSFGRALGKAFAIGPQPGRLVLISWQGANSGEAWVTLAALVGKQRCLQDRLQLATNTTPSYSDAADGFTWVPDTPPANERASRNQNLEKRSREPDKNRFYPRLEAITKAAATIARLAPIHRFAKLISSSQLCRCAWASNVPWAP
jgi:hypothetical protein